MRSLATTPAVCRCERTTADTRSASRCCDFQNASTHVALTSACWLSQDCVVDTNGKCINRNNAVTPFILAQRNRTYCELDDAVCNVCLEKKKMDSLGFCAGANNCYCTALCASGAYLDDGREDIGGDLVYIGVTICVVAFAVIVWRFCGIKLCCRKSKLTYADGVYARA